MTLDIQLTHAGGVTTAALFGAIDGKTAPVLEAALLPRLRPQGKLLLDMSHVSYMSSAGLRVLLLLYRRVHNQDGRIVLVSLSPMLRDTMEITGFLDFFDDHPTVEAGLAALGRDGAT